MCGYTASAAVVVLIACLTQVYNNCVIAARPRVLQLSVNIKGTAGCCVFRKQVSAQTAK